MQNNREPLLQSQASSIDETIANEYNLIKEQNEKLLLENEMLKKNLLKEELYHHNLYKQWNELNASVVEKERELEQFKSTENPQVKVYQYAFYGLLLITVLLAIFNFYSFKHVSKTDSNPPSVQNSLSENKDIAQPVYPQTQKASTAEEAGKILHKKNENSTDQTNPTPAVSQETDKSTLSDNALNIATNKVPAKYVVKTKSYFHNRPDENTRRTTFVLPWDDAYGVLTALDDRNGFIYVVFKNRAGRTSKGWINKNDLEPLNQ